MFLYESKTTIGSCAKVVPCAKSVKIRCLEIYFSVPCAKSNPGNSVPCAKTLENVKMYH